MKCGSNKLEIVLFLKFSGLSEMKTKVKTGDLVVTSNENYRIIPI